MEEDVIDKRARHTAEQVFASATLAQLERVAQRTDDTHRLVERSHIRHDETARRLDATEATVARMATTLEQVLTWLTGPVDAITGVRAPGLVAVVKQLADARDEDVVARKKALEERKEREAKFFGTIMSAIVPLAIAAVFNAIVNGLKLAHVIPQQ